jgi:hypothetical protein
MLIIGEIGAEIKGIIGAKNDQLGIAIMEGLVLRIFNQFNEEQLYEAICSNRNLWCENWGDYERYRRNIMMVAQDPKYAPYRDWLTVENVLEWMRRRDAKPRFASIIVNTPGGAAWLDCQIQSILQGSAEKVEVNKDVRGAAPAAD